MEDKKKFIVIQIASRYKTIPGMDYSLIGYRDFFFPDKSGECDITSIFWNAVKYLRENPDEDIQITIENSDNFTIENGEAEYK